MKKVKRMLQLTVTLLLMFWVALPSTSFSEVDPQAIQTQVQDAIAVAQAAGQEVDAALIESIAANVMNQNVAPDDVLAIQVEGVADAIMQAVVALNTSLGLNLAVADVVMAASSGAVQGVTALVASGTIPESMSNALQVAADDGASTGAADAGVPMDTVLLIGSTPSIPEGEDTPDPGEAEAFEPAGDKAPVQPPPPLIPLSAQDLGASSPL
mgnify:CR=1 FL=1